MILRILIDVGLFVAGWMGGTIVAVRFIGKVNRSLGLKKGQDFRVRQSDEIYIEAIRKAKTARPDAKLGPGELKVPNVYGGVDRS